MNVAGLVAALRTAGATVATGESLTGGLVSAMIVDVAGASDVFRGGVVAYLPDLKVSLLDVSAELIRSVGTVHEDVAVALADGARRRCRATYGIGTTGVAGPGPAEGHRAGTVFVAVSWSGGHHVRGLELEGDRSEVRHEAGAAALSLLAATLGEHRGSAGR